MKSTDNDALWFDENDVDTTSVSDINCPNENGGYDASYKWYKGVDSKSVDLRCLSFYLSLI